MPLRELSASPDRIDIWVTRPDQVTDDDLLKRYRALLAPEEGERMQRFVRDMDRHRFLVTRALTRSVLGRYLSVEAAALQFGKNRYGRPFLQNGGDDAQTLSFNITHTHDCVVLGITRQRTLGIDIESTSRRAATLGIADKHFSERECRALNALPAADQQQRFFAYWTLKESYIKARGMVLAIPLGKFSFDFADSGHFSFATDPDLQDDAAQWRFWQIGIAEDFLISICASTMDEPLPALNPHAIIPLADDGDPLPFRPVAASHGWPDHKSTG